VTRRANGLRVRGSRGRVHEVEELILAELDSGRPTCVLDLVGDGSEYTLDEAGQHLNLTRERVRQIEVKALLRIRNERTSDLLEDVEILTEPHDPLESSPW